VCFFVGNAASFAPLRHEKVHEAKGIKLNLGGEQAFSLKRQVAEENGWVRKRVELNN
jgi:hypothetical protein